MGGRLRAAGCWLTTGRVAATPCRAGTGARRGVGEDWAGGCLPRCCCRQPLASLPRPACQSARGRTVAMGGGAWGRATGLSRQSCIILSWWAGGGGEGGEGGEADAHLLWSLGEGRPPLTPDWSFAHARGSAAAPVVPPAVTPPCLPAAGGGTCGKGRGRGCWRVAGVGDWGAPSGGGERRRCRARVFPQRSSPFSSAGGWRRTSRVSGGGGHGGEPPPRHLSVVPLPPPRIGPSGTLAPLAHAAGSTMGRGRRQPSCGHTAPRVPVPMVGAVAAPVVARHAAEYSHPPSQAERLLGRWPLPVGPQGVGVPHRRDHWCLRTRRTGGLVGGRAGGRPQQRRPVAPARGCRPPSWRAASSQRRRRRHASTATRRAAGAPRVHGWPPARWTGGGCRLAAASEGRCGHSPRAGPRPSPALTVAPGEVACLPSRLRQGKHRNLDTLAPARWRGSEEDGHNRHGCKPCGAAIASVAMRWVRAVWATSWICL